MRGPAMPESGLERSIVSEWLPVILGGECHAILNELVRLRGHAASTSSGAKGKFETRDGE
jgi:hypothetical protein